MFWIRRTVTDEMSYLRSRQGGGHSRWNHIEPIYSNGAGKKGC
jgi:hypothetical protein